MTQTNEFYNPFALRKSMKGLRRVGRGEFLSMLRPCDILVTFLDSKKFSFQNAAFAKFIKTFQGGKFASSKLYTGQGELIGYGAKKGPVRISSLKISTFMNRQGGIAICRYPGLTDSQKKKIVNYVRSRINTPYASSQLLKTAVDRISGRVLGGFFEDLSVEDIETMKEPLICSNLINLAYISAGVYPVPSKHPLDVWPVDFLTSEMMEPVAQWEL